MHITSEESNQTLKSVLDPVFYMGKRYFIDAVISKELLSNKKPIFVAHSVRLGITSQGKTMDEAKLNLKEAAELYLEEEPERYEELASDEAPFFSMVEVMRHTKAAHRIR